MPPQRCIHLTFRCLSHAHGVPVRSTNSSRYILTCSSKSSHNTHPSLLNRSIVNARCLTTSWNCSCFNLAQSTSGRSAYPNPPSSSCSTAKSCAAFSHSSFECLSTIPLELTLSRRLTTREMFSVSITESSYVLLGRDPAGRVAGQRGGSSDAFRSGVQLGSCGIRQGVMVYSPSSLFFCSGVTNANA